jgi:E3 ubiquitin-protein ligase UBR4
LQGLDGEATEPMIKELEEEREESLDPEIEFSIVGAVREFGGLEIILSMIQVYISYLYRISGYGYTCM